MTLSRLIPFGTAAAFLAFAAFSSPAPLSAQEAAAETLTPEAALDARVAAMKALGGANRALAPLAAGQAVAPAAVGQAAKTMHDKAVELASLFPAGSSSADLATSYSLPVVWSDSEGFAKALENFTKASKGLEDAAAAGDSAAIGAAFAELRPTCGACHQTYRKPKD